MRTCSMFFSNLQVPTFRLRPPSLRVASLGRTIATTAISQSPSKCFGSVQYSDAQAKILDNKVLKNPVKILVWDLETTHISRKRGRVVEVAFRDLQGGENSCFQTLVNPEQHITNSSLHGITTDMVNHSHVPRMEELIPIILKYVESRQVTGWKVILAAHNARCFDVPFLIKEFGCCSVDIPPHWLFLDTLYLARELRKLYGPTVLPKISLEGLREFYNIPLECSNHRAMSDVNVLSAILAKMSFDLKLSVNDLLERTFQASALLEENKRKKRLSAARTPSF